VTYTAEVWASTDSSVAAWTKNRYVPAMSKQMADAGFPVSPYVNFRKSNDARSGIEAGPSTPRFSTGYCALRDRPALLIETHMLKDYATRVKGTYAMLQQSLAVIGSEHARLRDVIAAADARASALEKQEIPVSFEVNHNDSVMIDFRASITMKTPATSPAASGCILKDSTHHPDSLFRHPRVTATACACRGISFRPRGRW
jgi:hypothetical protein